MIELVGNTPLVELKVLNKNPNVKIYAKLEGQNPGGSVKDRAALNMISQAIERGELDGNKHIVEATSGNTGIALAMIAALKKIPITLLMPESATHRRNQRNRTFQKDCHRNGYGRKVRFARPIWQPGQSRSTLQKHRT